MTETIQGIEDIEANGYKQTICPDIYTKDERHHYCRCPHCHIFSKVDKKPSPESIKWVCPYCDANCIIKNNSKKLFISDSKANSKTSIKRYQGK